MIVTIVVVTYNSSSYVEETLNSVSKQTFPHDQLEIIISDDCSTDNTPNICRKFVEDHKENFYNVLFIQTSCNKGICGNYNNALERVHGEWIKYIAGDDRLKPNCIERFVANISEKDEFMCCGREEFTNDLAEATHIVFQKNLDAENGLEQLKNCIRMDFLGIIWGCTFFLKTSFIREFDGFDERFPMAEDWPLCMKYLLQDRGRIKEVHETLVEYRCYTESVSRSSKYSTILMERAYCLSAELHTRMYLYWIHTKINFFIREYSNRSVVYRLIGYIIRLFDYPNYKKKYLK